MFKKIIAIFFVLFFLFIPDLVSAQENKVNIYFFWSQSCPHCAKEKAFLQEIAPKYPNLVLHDYEVNLTENYSLLQKIGDELNIVTGGVPITIIGNSHFVGYLDDETTGQTIINLIEEVSLKGDSNSVGKIISSKEETVVPTSNIKSVPEQIKVPILGSVDTKKLSLPILTIVIAAMDGFNPCAMWTLLFLISLLLGMKDRKRMWILGGTFIVTSAVVYFLFLSAWLNLFLFLGFIVWVRIAIGILAIGAGGYYLRDYVKNKSGGCNVMGDTKRQKIFEKIRDITQRKEFLLALGGIIILALTVNIVELVCSAGLPAIYTQILSLSHLNPWQHYGYLLLYVLIFMLDDLFIFFTAMITLQATGIQSKYSRFSHLVGGVLMVIIGLLLLFKPELLMFG
jgi:thiol-disulfide isomerase/thioredoxin